MKIKDLNWNKTKAQCPHCGRWYTRQGILGHIRFRHPDKSEMDTLEKRLHQADKSERDALGETLDQLFYAKASNLVLTAADMMNREGRLSGELRRNLLDIMLLDYLHKQIINSRRVH